MNKEELISMRDELMSILQEQSMTIAELNTSFVNNKIKLSRVLKELEAIDL